MRASRTSIIQRDKGPGAGAGGSWDEEMDRDASLVGSGSLSAPQVLRLSHSSQQACKHEAGFQYRPLCL